MTVRYRGWRFVVPGRDEPDPSAGLRTAPTGALATVEDDDAVRQALLLLLATRPGERVMRPEYGCDLHRLLFAPNDDTTAGLAMHYVRQAVERWEPRVDIVGVDATRVETQGQLLEVVLDYRVRATRRLGRLVVPVPVADGEPA
ncbi:MAG: GPW/gp25 family protein [Solirubrobacteraceae bacterium]